MNKYGPNQLYLYIYYIKKYYKIINKKIKKNYKNNKIKKIKKIL